MKKLSVAHYFLLLNAITLSACDHREIAQTNSQTIQADKQLDYLNLDPKTQYVGDEACSNCHYKIYTSFKQSGMGRSFYPVSGSKRIEDVTRNNQVYDPRSKMHYEVVAKGKNLYQIEYRLDEGGRRTHELARKIDYIIGSGSHARTYLSDENHFLYEMPVTWFTLKRSWAMSPGFDSVNYRFSRPIKEACMDCHNSYAKYVPYSINRFTGLPHGIGCERCHGPGELHVEKYAGPQDISSTGKKEEDKTIVDPQRLPASYQLDVCFQCHLQGMGTVFKPNKQMYDFRPGMHLKDVLSIYIPENSSPADLRVASHGLRLTLSQCYIKGSGRLTCITCHDPHVPIEDVPRSSFNTKCMSCHSLATLSQGNPKAEHSAKGDCVACHMRQGRTSDVIHANFTDHWIQKEPAARQSTHHDEAAALKDFFGEKDAGAKLRLDVEYLKLNDEPITDTVYFDHLLSQVRDDLQSNPTNEEALNRLGLGYLERGRLHEAIEQLRVLIRLDPKNALAYWELANAWEKSGEREKAVESYRTALDLFPENAVALTELGNLYVLSNKPSDALDCFQKAAAADPSYAPAYNDVGEYFLYQQWNPVTAKNNFQEALSLEPDYFPAIYNLGMLNMDSKNFPEAKKYFKSALALNPKFVGAYGNLAVIFFSEGHTVEARSYLQRALHIDPQNIEIKGMLKRLESSGNAKMN